MIPEYKLYHGAVLAELVQRLSRPVLIHELSEPGRLSSYVIDGEFGVQIKHSSQRMNPWPFTLTRQNLDELETLRANCSKTFIVFVCHTDGMVCVPLSEVMGILEVGGSDQAWIRIDRRKRQWYCVSGAKGELGTKKPKGLDALIKHIDHSLSAGATADECAMPQTREHSRFSFFSRALFR